MEIEPGLTWEPFRSPRSGDSIKAPAHRPIEYPKDYHRFEQHEDADHPLGRSAERAAFPQEWKPEEQRGKKQK